MPLETRRKYVLLRQRVGATTPARVIKVVDTLSEAKMTLMKHVNRKAMGSVKFGRHSRTATYSLGGDKLVRVFIKRRKL